METMSPMIDAVTKTLSDWRVLAAVVAFLTIWAIMRKIADVSRRSRNRSARTAIRPSETVPPEHLTKDHDD